MEEVGAQVASPIFFHQALPGRFCEAPPMAKKRDLAWQNANFQQQQQQRLNPAFQNPKANWKPQVWDWDSTRFVAKPSEAEVLRLGTAPVVESLKEKKGEETLTPMLLKKNAVDEEGESLTLKLGGSSYSVDETAARPNKRVRSGSPGGGNYPMCQVDDCKGDLSNAKDYHRRHKVCEFHSKTTKALVGKQMQRFCQQCSRFHPLSEFDEGKRSCRRRLAGHNRRRRKTQPEDVSSRLLLPDNCENTGSENLNVVNLLSIISRLQGNNANKGANCSPLPDKDQLIQILNKINSLPLHANSTSRLPAPGSFDLNISQQASLDHLNKTYGSTSAQSTMDLLAVLSAALAAASPDALAMLSHRSSNSSDDDKTKSNCLDQAAGCTAQKKSTSGFPSVVGERSSSNFQSPAEILDCQIQDSRPSLPFQLFSSSPEGNSPPKLGSSRKYFSSESSNPMEERSPSSSPVVQKLFPLQSATEIIKHERMSINGEDNATVAASTTHSWIPSLELFNVPNGRVEHGSAQNLPYQAGYSSSGSDHSPSSSNSDAQDRTGRIIFKLFDKDPSDLPGTLRTQILNWLSNSPSEMESYIRPGCVVLSVFVSMPSTAWEQLQDGLLRHVNSLIKDSDSSFWQNGRFLVHTGRQLVSHKDGKVRLCKSWRTWSAPELISVSPLAVVGGQETSLVLRGRNLTVPGTKIHCTYMGGYMSKETSGSAYQGTAHDEISLESFKFPGGAPGVLGRCFVEVENGFKGNSFPVIIADATICHELKHLESEFEEDAKMSYVVSEDRLQDSGQPRSREDVLLFLNELGWLFQKNNTPSRPEGINFSHSRFKFLFTFSVERDWCALVKTLLDILVERNLGKDGLWKESLETLSEIQLLNRAVKRKCWNMVDLLIHYSLTSSGNATKKYLFPPNIAGPGGVTPLHLAACMQDLEDMVDVLTNDPQEIGLGCWNSLLDANGQSPFAYASMRNNHSYNSLVARKIADRKHGQVSIAVGDEISLDRSWILAEQADKPDAQSMQRQQSCARCAVVATRNFKRMPGAQGLLYRPYVHSMLAIAAVCVCVCLFLRGSPDIGSVAPFKWETLGYGWS